MARMRAATREATEPKMALLLPFGSGCKVNMSTKVTKIDMITNQQSQESSEHNQLCFYLRFSLCAGLRLWFSHRVGAVVVAGLGLQQVQRLKRCEKFKIALKIFFWRYIFIFIITLNTLNIILIFIQPTSASGRDSDSA